MGVLIDGITETVKHEIKKKQEGRFLPAFIPPLAASLVQPVSSSVVKGISERGVRRAGRRYMEKIFCSVPSFKQYLDYFFNYEPRFNDVFSRSNLPRIKDGAYIINLDYKKSKGTHWVSLFIKKNTAA